MRFTMLTDRVSTFFVFMKNRFFIYFKFFLEEVSPLCGATNIPVLDFL